MFRRITVVLLALALAGLTMGQDSCGTESGGGGDETTAAETEATERQDARERKREEARARKRAEARERKREKRRERKRREREKRRREARVTPPAPEPEAPAAQEDCHPSYKGACLDPDASDYDCAGGSGDGPKYAEGPITVVGSDDYDLDRDGDGTACES
jgi:hypothetical protein